jgi:hypothetical protein
VTRPTALYLINLFNVVFTTERLLQIIVVLGATAVLKWVATGHDAGWLTALVG